MKYPVSATFLRVVATLCLVASVFSALAFVSRVIPQLAAVRWPVTFEINPIVWLFFAAVGFGIARLIDASEFFAGSLLDQDSSTKQQKQREPTDIIGLIMIIIIILGISLWAWSRF